MICVYIYIYIETWFWGKFEEKREHTEPGFPKLTWKHRLETNIGTYASHIFHNSSQTRKPAQLCTDAISLVEALIIGRRLSFLMMFALVFFFSINFRSALAIIGHQFCGDLAGLCCAHSVEMSGLCWAVLDRVHVRQPIGLQAFQKHGNKQT